MAHRICAFYLGSSGDVARPVDFTTLGIIDSGCLLSLRCGRHLQDSPAEHSRGTPSKASPTEAACAATTLAAWMWSVRDTIS